MDHPISMQLDGGRPDEQTIERYLRGDCSAEELATVQAWAQREPKSALVLEALRVRLAQPWGEFDTARVGALQEKLRVELHEGATRAPSSGWVAVREKVVRPGWPGMDGIGTRTLRIGVWFGTLCALVVGMVALMSHSWSMHHDTTRVYVTHPYQQAVLNLDEGTRVTLAPQTVLRVLRFEKQSRIVQLERGEAYFEVARASSAPFVVRSGTVTTRVLGTAFLIRSDPHSPHVRVAVTDGKVEIVTAAHTGFGVTLTTGQVGEVIDSTMHVSTAEDLAPRTEWMPGRVIFHDTPLATILQTITRWYGYQFRYADPKLVTQSVTMTVSTRSSAEALTALEWVLGVNLNVIGDTVTLVPQPTRSSRSAPRIRTYDVWTPTREVGR